MRSYRVWKSLIFSSMDLSITYYIKQTWQNWNFEKFHFEGSFIDRLPYVFEIPENILSYGSSVFEVLNSVVDTWFYKLEFIYRLQW